MGRLVTATEQATNPTVWEWKFAFADQSSSFGEVIEAVCQEGAAVTRYIGENGEVIRITIYNREQLVDECETYISDHPIDPDVKPNSDGKFGDEYWNSRMVKSFAEAVLDKRIPDEAEFDVDY